MMKIDNDTMKAAIILTMKSKVEAFMKKGSEAKDLLEAAACYDAVANVIRETHSNIQELDNQEK